MEEACFNLRIHVLHTCRSPPCDRMAARKSSAAFRWADSGNSIIHWKKWKRIRTGLPEDATECAPCADFEDGIWKISFIAGGWKGDRRFRLYRMYGLHGEVMAQQFADVGFVHKNCVAYASRRGPLFLVEPCRRIILTFHGVEFLYRVSYDPFEPNRLLISGQYPGGEIFPGATSLDFISCMKSLRMASPPISVRFSMTVITRNGLLALKKGK